MTSGIIPLRINPDSGSAIFKFPGFKLWKGCNMTRSKYNIGHIAPSVTQFVRVICMGNTHGNNLSWTQRICVVTYNSPALVQIMAWHICVSLRTHTCVTRPQWIMRTRIGLLAHICIGERDQNSMRWWFQFSVKSISTPMLPHDHYIPLNMVEYHFCRNSVVWCLQRYHRCYCILEWILIVH